MRVLFKEIRLISIPEDSGTFPLLFLKLNDEYFFFLSLLYNTPLYSGVQCARSMISFYSLQTMRLRSINLYIADMKSRCFQMYFFLNCERFLISCILHCLSFKFYCMHFYKSINFKGPLNARFTIKIISLRWKFIDVTKLLNPFFVYKLINYLHIHNMYLNI